MGFEKTVLVTGGLGYIGSVLTPHLEARGLRCVAYDPGFFGDCWLFPPREPEVMSQDARHFRRHDLDGVNAVVHLAGISNDPFGDLEPAKIYDPTRAYALHVAGLCKEAGVRFIFASSCSVYGRALSGVLTEDSDTVPQTPYSLNKLQIEEDPKQISGDGFSPIIFRFATVHGLSPRMMFDLVINMLTGMAVTTGKIILNSDGRAWRPHVHIMDVCKAIRAAIDLDYQADEPLILNVGDTRQNFQVLDVAEKVRAHVPGCELLFLHDCTGESRQGLDLVRDRKIRDNADTRTYRVSFERIKEVLPGFQCDWTVEDGIQSMIEGFEEMELTETQFRNRDFYRLQKIESLFTSGALTEDLFWAKGRGPLPFAGPARRKKRYLSPSPDSRRGAFCLRQKQPVLCAGRQGD